jgi:hypothetical protein
MINYEIKFEARNPKFETISNDKTKKLDVRGRRLEWKE